MTKNYDAAHTYVVGETCIDSIGVEWVAQQSGTLPEPPLRQPSDELDPSDNEHWRARVFEFLNNRNTLVQRDRDGNRNNLGYIDADFGYIAGPVSNPKMTTLFSEMKDMFRPHIHADFYAPSLPPMLQFSGTGTGSYSIANGELGLHTGVGLGSVAMVKMPAVPAYFVNQLKVKFYLRTAPNGNLRLEFGVASDDGQNYIKFDRTEDNVAQAFRCENCYNGAPYAQWAPAGGDSNRRLFEVKINGDFVEYWMSDLPGQAYQGHPELVARFANSKPFTGAIGRPFVKITSRYSGAPRSVFISDIYAMPLK